MAESFSLQFPDATDVPKKVPNFTVTSRGIGKENLHDKELTIKEGHNRPIVIKCLLRTVTYGTVR